jgi:hypothetical protein
MWMKHMFDFLLPSDSCNSCGFLSNATALMTIADYSPFMGAGTWEAIHSMLTLLSTWSSSGSCRYTWALCAL